MNRLLWLMPRWFHTLLLRIFRRRLVRFEYMNSVWYEWMSNERYAAFRRGDE